MVKVNEGVQEEVREGMQDRREHARKQTILGMSRVSTRDSVPSRIAKVEVANSAYLSKDGWQWVTGNNG